MFFSEYVSQFSLPDSPGRHSFPATRDTLTLEVESPLWPTQTVTKIMSLKIFHNPRCSKSRQTLDLLTDKGFEPEIVKYLETPPTAAELREILALLGLGARDLLRSGEAEFKELGLGDASLGEDELIDAMVRHPKLIQRPIVVTDKAARLGRPPESVLEIL